MAVVPFKIGYLHEREAEDPADLLHPIQLRFDEALDSGEIDRPIELLVEHGYGLPGGSAELCQDAWQRLADRGALAIIGPGNTDNALAIMNQAEAQHLSTINWSGCERTRSQYVFHYQVGSLPDEGPLIAAAVAATGAHNVAVIRDRSPIGNEYWEYFSEATERHDLSVVTDQKISPIATDLHTQVLAAQASGAEVLVYLGFGGILPAMWQAQDDVGWRPPSFTNTAGMHWYTMTAEVRRHGTGWIYVDMYDEYNSVTQALLDALEVRQGTRPFGPLAPAVYDMASLVVGALHHATVHTREGVNQGLERVHLVPAALGGAGTIMGFGPWERTALKGADYLLFRVMAADTTHRYAAYPPSYERLSRNHPQIT